MRRAPPGERQNWLHREFSWRINLGFTRKQYPAVCHHRAHPRGVLQFLLRRRKQSRGSSRGILQGQSIAIRAPTIATRDRDSQAAAQHWRNRKRLRTHHCWLRYGAVGRSCCALPLAALATVAALGPATLEVEAPELWASEPARLF